MTLVERVVRVLRQGVEWFPDRFYAHRHPGAAGRFLISLLAPLVVRLTPNDKWSLGVHLPFWLRALEVPAAGPLPPSKRIFLFCAYRIQFTHDFMVAILLAWRGHRVTFGYLPKLQSPIKPPLVDHPSAKPYLTAVLGRVEAWSKGRIRCVDLSEIAIDDGPVDEGFIRSQVLGDTIMCIRRETVDRTDPEVAKTWSYYEDLARDSHAIARAYLSPHLNEFDLMVVANGATFEPAQFCHVSRALGLPVNTFEKFDFRGIRVINHGNHFLAFDDLASVWSQRRELGFHDEPFRSFAVDHALTLLNERRRGSTANWGWAFQKSPNQSARESLQAAGVGDGRRFVLVGTNVPYDAGYACLLGLFSSMREWLYETVRFLLEHTDIHVVVRAHPGEAAHYGGKERSEETLAEFIGHERLTMIPGEQTANTYNLIENCHFGVVFSSTVGMELAMFAKTAVIGANVYYGRRGFTVDSDNRDEYFGHLRRLAAAEQIPPLDAEASKEAALFHFVFHFVMLWPYPYDKPSGVRETPIPRLLRSGRMARYIPFLDALACTREEWEARLGDFFSPGGNNHIPVPKRAA